MTRCSIAASKPLVVFATLMFAGLPLAANAQPGPEHKKLDYLVGKWKVELEIKATGTTPASKASGTEECEWFANLHIVCRGEATGAAGLYKEMRTISYVPALKQYASYSVDSLGYARADDGRDRRRHMDLQQRHRRLQDALGDGDEEGRLHRHRGICRRRWEVGADVDDQGDAREVAKRCETGACDGA